MRIHTSVITDADGLADFLPDGVGFGKPVTTHRSHSRALAYEVALSGHGTTGGQFGQASFRTAVWDEWGLFLDRLYADDPDAIAGPYVNVAVFDWVTDGAYSDLTADDIHLRHKWTADFITEWTDVRYREETCRCGRVRRSPILPATIADFVTI